MKKEKKNQVKLEKCELGKAGKAGVLKLEGITQSCQYSSSWLPKGYSQFHADFSLHAFKLYFGGGKLPHLLPDRPGN